MTNIQKIGKLVVLFLAFAGLSSCLKNDNEAPFTMIAEVATVKRMINNEVNYARMFYAYGTQPMSSVKVTLAEGGSLILSPFDTGKRTWYKDPETADFSTETPALGEYVFTVVNEDIEHTFTDQLGSKELGFPTISNITSNFDFIGIEWNTLNGADEYQVIVKNDQNEFLYSGPKLSSGTKKFEVSAATGLRNELLNGETYVVELRAAVYEDTIDGEKRYNIEEMSITSLEIVIGEAAN